MKNPLAFLAALLLSTPAAAQLVEDVPFVVTPDHVTLAMLELAKVTAQDYVIDLGSGDGRIVITAAKRFGARGLGVEIDPSLVKESIESARKAGVADRAEFREQDLFATDLSKATVITLYLLPEVNLRLRPSLLALKPGTRVVSHDWDMAGWKADSSITLAVPDKKLGLKKSSTVHLWIVPARVAGKWCGRGSLAGKTLTLDQEFQHVSGQLIENGRAQSFKGKVEGADLVGATGVGSVYALRIVNGQLDDGAKGGSFEPLAKAGLCV